MSPQLLSRIGFGDEDGMELNLNGQDVGVSQIATVVLEITT